MIMLVPKLLLVSSTNSSADLTEAQRYEQLEELQYKLDKLKRKMIGTINFIGELYNLQ